MSTMPPPASSPVDSPASSVASDCGTLQCPICDCFLGSGGASFRYEIPKYRFCIYECPTCKLQMKGKQPQDRDPHRFYNASYFRSGKTEELEKQDTVERGEKAKYNYNDERENLDANRVVWKARLQTIASFVAPPARLLDVGCAFGGFVLQAQEFGYQAEGVDVSAYAVREGNRAGARTKQLALEELENADEITHARKLGKANDHTGYNIVTLIEVIEHIADPKRAFSALASLLKDQGLLVIQTANFSGWQAKWAGADYHYYLPGHYYYYSKENLERALRAHGFILEYCFRPVDFSLVAKLKKVWLTAKMKNRAGNSQLWLCLRAGWYHVVSLLAFGNFSLTSSMVLYFRKSKPR